MKKGQLVGVVWCDIQTDPTGDPGRAEPRVVRLPGYFLGYQEFIVDGKTLDCLLLGVSHDDPGETQPLEMAPQTGWWCIPRACVISMKPLKSRKR